MPTWIDRCSQGIAGRQGQFKVKPTATRATAVAHVGTRRIANVALELIVRLVVGGFVTKWTFLENDMGGCHFVVALGLDNANGFAVFDNGLGGDI